MNGTLSVTRLSVTPLPVSSNDAIVEEVSFAVAPGESVGLVGESGSGKSVTLKAIAGLLPPGLQVSGGSVSVDSRQLAVSGPRAYLTRRGSIATVLQDPSAALNPLMRAGDHIAMVRRTVGGIPAAEAHTQTIQLLRDVHLVDAESIARRYPHELSGGQRQRVMIAVALASDPLFILCDEPTTALDVTVQADILALLSRIRQEKGVGLVFVTHDLPVVAQVTERLLVMQRGRVVETGPTRAVVTSPQHPYTQRLVESARRLQEDRAIS